jgi:hypothetical protein
MTGVVSVNPKTTSSPIAVEKQKKVSDFDLLV